MVPAYSLKRPLVIDLSDGEPGPSLDAANPKPVAVLMEACVARYPSAAQTYRCVDVRTSQTDAGVWNSAQQNGVKFGVYAYILQNQIPLQAQTLIDHCTQAGFFANGRWQLDFPPVADVEVEVPLRDPKKTPRGYVRPVRYEAWAAQVKEWLDLVQNGLGITPWIYTAAEQWKYLVGNKGTGSAPAWTGNYRFWLKFYPLLQYVDANVTFPPSALPAGVTLDNVVLWQYREHGRDEGYEYDDLNVPTAAGALIFGI